MRNLYIFSLPIRIFSIFVFLNINGKEDLIMYNKSYQEKKIQNLKQQKKKKLKMQNFYNEKFIITVEAKFIS